MSTNNTTTFPEWVNTPKEKILFKFLSNLSDHFGKSMFWLKAQHSLYCTKYERFDSTWLKETLHYYLMNDMHTFLPTLPQVTEYLRAKPGYQDRWERRDFTNGKRFCNDCKTDADGLEGGFRQIYMWDRTTDKETEYMAPCTCDAGKCMKGYPYTTVISNLQVRFKNAEIHYSYRNHRHYLVSAKEQSEKKWHDRIKAGRCIYNEGTGEYIPNFKHPIYKTFIGIQICADEGWTMPEELLNVITENQAYNNAVKYYRMKRTTAKALKDSPYVPTPQSMAQAMTGFLSPNVEHRDLATLYPSMEYTQEIDSDDE